MKLIYINDGLSPVIHSQVFSLLNYYAKNDFFEEVTLLNGYKNIDELKQLKKRLSKQVFKYSFFQSYPNYSFFNVISRINIHRAIKKMNPEKETVVHIRGDVLGYIVFPILIKNKLFKTVVDIRGAGLEEYSEFGKKNILSSFKKKNLVNAGKNLFKFAKITTVSEVLKIYVKEKTPQKISNISTIPCFADKKFEYNPETRIEFRKKLNFKKNDIVLIFISGGGDAWQETDILQKFADMGFKILNLSKFNLDHPNIITTYVSSNDVPKYLMAADIALLFRKKSTVNHVALPVKFVEYICSGLPVIANKNVNSVTSYIQTTGHGVLISEVSESIRNEVLELVKISKNEVSAVGKETFGIDQVSSEYISIYKSLDNVHSR